MVAVRTIAVRERSTTPISEQDFRRLEQSHQFWSLADRRIVSLVRSAEIPYGVRSGPYVGGALIDSDLRLTIEEKSPGALRALVGWATPEDVAEAEAPSIVARGGPVLEVFAERFLLYLGDYLRHGRLRAYVRVQTETTFPRGRVDLRKTLRLRARGVQTRLVCDQPVLTPDLVCNRLIGLGLRALEQFLATSDELAEQLTMARTYSPLFDDVGWRALERRGHAPLRAMFDQAMEDSLALPDLRRALAYARAFVLHFGAWPDYDDEGQIPTSYFLSLETLFEDAVRQAIQKIVPAGKGSSFGVALFDDLADRYVVDPDIVVGAPPATQLVADCKYKDLDGYPDHPDIYQLVAHCGSLRSTNGMLIYPGVENRTWKIGHTAGALNVFVSTVVPGDLHAALSSALQHVGVG